jgi:membrane-bound lytic murein transglycosylase MltF
VLFVLLIITAVLVITAPSSAQDDPFSAVMTKPVAERTGDLDEMRERGAIRVLVTYNKTNFFVAGGKLGGFEYELLREYEKHVNKNVSRREIETKFYFVPVAKDQLIPMLIQGRGDIAAAGLTITPKRQRQAAFSTPYLTGVEEIIVTGANVKDVNTISDLAGHDVYVVKGSSYVEHLREINRLAEHFNMPPIEIIEMEQFFETEDLLEMANAGIIDFVVADRHLAELWAKVLENITVREDFVIHTGGELAWAVRKENPTLLSSINDFMKRHKKGMMIGNVLFDRYYEGTKWITNPLSSKKQKRIEELRGLFKEYATQYNFDWLGLAALAYQESGLDQTRKSRRGAIGIMQVTRPTAEQMGITDIDDVRNNIHAGVRYLDWIRTTYFNDPAIDAFDKVNFSLAAYNAGPRRVARMRKKAESLGYDPDVWFKNVERAALRDVGQETVRYVANITKYYIAFKLSEERYKKIRGGNPTTESE